MTGSTTTVQELTQEILAVTNRKTHQSPLDQQSTPQNPEVKNKEIPLIDQTFPVKIVWRNVILFAYLHLTAVFGLYLALTGQVKWQTFIWAAAIHVTGSIGVTAGCHRLWSHKSYKANLPLRILLATMQTFAFQNSVHEWSRDHRVHHKYSETNADPHNAKRGFFFAHIGWLLCRKHPALIQKGKGLDLSDLEADAVVMFQKKYYLILVLFCCFIFPPAVCMYFWGESLMSAIFFATLCRYCISLHGTWLVNSAAHLWGPKPYDKGISPAENLFVSLVAVGEGWHNYHHTFPWDYKTDELGRYRTNLTAAFLDFFAWIGWAYDLKTVPKEVVMARVGRTGDGSHHSIDNHHHQEEAPWGWGDINIPAADAEVTQTLYPAVSPVNFQINQLVN